MSRRYPHLLVFLAAVLSGFLSFGFSARPDPNDGFAITRVAVSRSGRWIAVASETGWIGIFDHENLDSPQRFRMLDSGAVRDLRFTPDEEWLVFSSGELWRHPAKILGSTEPITPAQDTSEPQRSASVNASQFAATSNVVPGPRSGTVLFGNAAGSVEVRDEAGKLVEQFTFR